VNVLVRRFFADKFVVGELKETWSAPIISLISGCPRFTQDPAAGKVSSLLDCYVPYEGFYDLRDYNMPIKIFKKLWKIQGALFKMNQNKEYYKKWHLAQW